jgi:hypothetical protein
MDDEHDTAAAPPPGTPAAGDEPRELAGAFEAAVDALLEHAPPGTDRDTARQAARAFLFDPALTGPESAAYHEAGHAVVGYVLGYRVIELRLLAADAGHTMSERPSGLKIWPYLPAPWGAYREMTPAERETRILHKRVRARTTMLMAGEAAADRLAGVGLSTRASPSSDWLTAAEEAAKLLRTPEAAADYARLARVRAGRLLGRRNCWRAVSALAAALLTHEHLDAAQIASIVAPIIGPPGSALGRVGRRELREGG